MKQEQQHGQDEVLSKEARMARVHRVASELLSTEEQYVTVLYLIDQVCTQILSNIVPLGFSLNMASNVLAYSGAHLRSDTYSNLLSKPQLFSMAWQT